MKTAMRSLVTLVLICAAAAFAQEPAPAPVTPEAAPVPQPRPEPAPTPAPKSTEPTDSVFESLKSAWEQSDLPKQLDELIEQAQRSSPDIKSAEAQLREAEAALRQTQLQVTQEITKLYNDLSEEREKMQELLKKQAQQKEPNETIQKQFNEAQAALSDYLAELRALIGVGAQPASKTAVPADLQSLDTHPRPKLQELQGSEILQILDSPVSVEFENQPFAVIADYLTEYFSLNLVLDPAVGQTKLEYIRLNDIPLKDGFLAMADMVGDLAFIVRPTYVFATTRENAQTINAPCIPDYLPLYITPEVATQLENESE